MRFTLNKDYKRLIIIPFLAFFLLPIFKVYSQGEATHLIEANIKLAICGNEVVERGEDCEPLLFVDFPCSLLGYGGEYVLCDNSCSFDLTACTIPEPPPPPVIEESIEKYIPKPRVTTTTVYEYPFLEYFDLNMNSRIDENEFVNAVKLWGEYWRLHKTESEELDSLKCDLNKDTKCDIVDLSILLYHSK